MSTMSNTTNLNIRIDNNLKKESDNLFKDLGLNMSTAITMFLKQCVKTESIPFKIERPKSIGKLDTALKEAEDIINNPDKYKGYNNIPELFEDLDSDD